MKASEVQFVVGHQIRYQEQYAAKALHASRVVASLCTSAGGKQMSQMKSYSLQSYIHCRVISVIFFHNLLGLCLFLTHFRNFEFFHYLAQFLKCLLNAK